MRSLHETTRKRICRGAFFALCVAPTCATLAWAIRWHMPGRTAERAARIAAPLHAQATLAGWREPKPGVVRVAETKLVDLASRAGLVEATRVESRTVSGVRVVTIERLTVDATVIPRVARRLQELLIAAGPKIHELCIDEIVIRTTAGETKLFEAIARAAGGEQGGFKIQAIVHARQEQGDADKNAVRITIEQSPADDDGAAPQTRLTIDSSGSALPAFILGELLPGVGELGANVTFAGRIDAELLGGRVGGSQMKGRLAGIDASKILPAGSPHVVQGMVAFDVEEAIWRNGAIVRLAGRLGGSDLKTSQSLLAAAERHLGVPPPSASGVGPAQLIDVDRLAATFVFDEAGLNIWGVCPKTDAVPPGCLATHGGQPLVMQPQYDNLQCARWVNFLTSEWPAKIPATRQSLEAARRLPWPREATTR